MPLSIKDVPHATPLSTVKGRLHFDHVSFSYNEGVEVLRDIDLLIEPGETVAVVGPTGGGKSTLVSLVPRLYDVSAGRITVDGMDIRDVTRESLTRQVSTVLQDPFLFTGTVAENIRYGRLNCDRRGDTGSGETGGGRPIHLQAAQWLRGRAPGDGK